MINNTKIDGINENVLYTQKFDLSELENNSKKAIEKLIQMKERNLNNYREDKQKEEEKNIDLTTKKKIYSSRMNIANTEVYE